MTAGRAYAPEDERRLERFARLAAPLLGGAAARDTGSSAARDRAGRGLEFLDLRAWLPGDDLRHVDWRRTRRRGIPVVRRYRDEAAADWFIGVDGSASMRFGGKWPMAVRLANALAYALIQAGHRPALAVFAESVRAWCAPGCGQRQFTAIARLLGDYRPPRAGGGSRPGACAGRLRRGGNFVLLSDFLRADGIAEELVRLAAGTAAGHAIQVLASDETSVGAAGSMLLVDCESGAAKRVTVSAAAVADAERALAAHRENLRRQCAAAGLRFSACLDSDDWERVLLAHLGCAG